jgi:hypothetical protein
MDAIRRICLLFVFVSLGYFTVTHFEAPVSVPISQAEQVTTQVDKTQSTPPIVVEAPVVAVEEPKPEPPKPKPIPTGNCSLAYNFDWPQDVAYAVCMAESSGNQYAHNGGDNHGSCVGSYGLFQIGCFWFPYYGHELSYDPQVNAQIAYNIWKRQGGFGAWTTYTGGKYLKYL